MLESNCTVLKKILSIIRYLAEKPYSFTAIEVSRDLGINRSTVHRILAELIEERMVIQNYTTKKYSLGPMAYHIGASYTDNKDYLVQIKYLVEDVAQQTKQSVGFAIMEQGTIINIYEVESFQPIKIGYRQGEFYPINCGVYGKCITAFHEPYEELEKIVYSTKLVKKTPNTIIDPERLMAEYREIRKQGYAISDEEGLLGAIGVGAPVRDYSGKVIGCLGVALVKNGLTESDFELTKEKIIEGAQKISKVIP
ncbi:MAG: KdgR family transcriptional regulator [Clostridia bacterium BRH_c25]|nr:MAG: KdgR family transcriptional regulator [Clostridia bacterium BRH_c25]